VDQYQQRSLRSDADLPVRFFSTDGLISGHTLDVSASGMLAEFEKPVAIWTIGELTILLEDGYINIGARVARADGRKAGLAFYIEGDDDRVAIGRLLTCAFASEQPQH
jgi:hypothetical protein